MLGWAPQFLCNRLTPDSSLLATLTRCFPRGWYLPTQVCKEWTHCLFALMWILLHGVNTVFWLSGWALESTHWLWFLMTNDNIKMDFYPNLLISEATSKCCGSLSSGTLCSLHQPAIAPSLAPLLELVWTSSWERDECSVTSQPYDLRTSNCHFHIPNTILCILLSHFASRNCVGFLVVRELLVPRDVHVPRSNWWWQVGWGRTWLWCLQWYCRGI